MSDVRTHMAGIFDPEHGSEADVVKWFMRGNKVHGCKATLENVKRAVRRVVEKKDKELWVPYLLTAAEMTKARGLFVNRECAFWKVYANGGLRILLKDGNDGGKT